MTEDSANVAVSTTVTGTRENVECSNRGLCDRASGLCVCVAGFVSSDGNGNAGTRGDCGFRNALFTGK